MKINLPSSVLEIFKRFTAAGFEIYIVGGAVRDILQKKPVKDWDFTTNAVPEKILKLFPQGFYDNVFGTVGIPIKVKSQKSKVKSYEIYEVTTFRTEHSYSDHRRPDKVVWGKSLEEDLSRRDFTINAMAIKVQSAKCKVQSYELMDIFNGQRDLKNQLIRCVGDADKRFNEDALRMMRAIRIASELEFQIEGKTLTAIKKNASLIRKISQERIRDELLKILAVRHPADGFTLLLSSGLLEQILPELLAGYGMAQAKHHIYDVWTHSLLSLKKCPSRDPITRFATLLHDIGKPAVARGEAEERTFYNHEIVGASIARNTAYRLKMKRIDREKLIALVRWHQFSVDEHQTDKAVRRFIRKVGKDRVKDIIDLRIGDRLGGGCRNATSWRLRLFMKRIIEVQKQPFSVRDLKINGHDIMQILKIKPGPKVGEILEKLFAEVEEDLSKNKRDYLLRRLKEISSQTTKSGAAVKVEE